MSREGIIRNPSSNSTHTMINRVGSKSISPTIKEFKPVTFHPSLSGHDYDVNGACRFYVNDIALDSRDVNFVIPNGTNNNIEYSFM